MKVLLVNGSPNENGCTRRALEEVGKALEQQGIQTELFWIGRDAFHSCTGCGTCAARHYCMFDDRVNVFLQKAEEVQGFLFGTPVHWAGPTGSLISFMDRVCAVEFFSKKERFYLKPAAAVISARRGGASATYDVLNKYFGFMQMPIVSTQYWNMAHGMTPQEMEGDTEGLQTMEILGNNMAYFLKCMVAGNLEGLEKPQYQSHILTNFIH